MVDIRFFIMDSSIEKFAYNYSFEISRTNMLLQGGYLQKIGIIVDNVFPDAPF